MDIQTLTKAANIFNAGCAIAMAGIVIYAAKQQHEMNKTIAETNQKIDEGRTQMKNWKHQIIFPQQ